MPPRLAAIHVYPVKSAAGLGCDHAEVEPRGLAGDRRWMVVDADGRFITGRQEPRLVLLRARVDDGTLQLSAPGREPLRVSAPASAERREVRVWRDTVDAVRAGDEADAWLGAWLGRPVQLVCMDARAVRAVDPDYAQAGDETSFADAFPLLLVSAAALDGLNARLASPASMARFRPNLVVDGVPAHAEDGWTRVRIGAVTFDVVKPCTRCVFTTVDPDSGTVDPAGEPLATLKAYRRGPTGVTFGQNLIPRGRGRVAVGDPIEILERKL